MSLPHRKLRNPGAIRLLKKPIPHIPVISTPSSFLVQSLVSLGYATVGTIAWCCMVTQPPQCPPWMGLQ